MDSPNNNKLRVPSPHPPSRVLRWYSTLFSLVETGSAQQGADVMEWSWNIQTMRTAKWP
jgi:hypothetical protein